MMLLAIAALQALHGLSNTLPREEELRFVFVQGDRGTQPKISGTNSTPTRWSGSSLLRVVRQCGGARLGVAGSNAHRIIVTSRSSTNNLDVARCVQASTSLDFSVGVRERGYAFVAFDQQPFRELWDR